tara:strand:- start:2250 stop:2819 length:570 start_codon:yes stop_codon:yes gene_type:complete
MAKQIIFSDSLYSEFLSNSQLDNHILELLQKAIKSKNISRRSNVNGIQTNNVLDEKLVNFFTPAIRNALFSFNIKNSYVKFLNAWVNKNTQNSYNNIHIHPHSHFAIVYYIKIPKDPGLLVFRRNDQTVEMQAYDEFFKTTDSFNKFEVEPKKQLFILFPSHLQHYVTINNTNEDRISLSCNIKLINNG